MLYSYTVAVLRLKWVGWGDGDTWRLMHCGCCHMTEVGGPTIYETRAEVCHLKTRGHCGIIPAIEHLKLTLLQDLDTKRIHFYLLSGSGPRICPSNSVIRMACTSHSTRINIHNIRAKLVTRAVKMFIPVLQISFIGARNDNFCKKSSKHISNC